MISKKNMSEILCGANISYVLDSTENFSQTEYRVLQSQRGGSFVDCMRMTRNGKPQLYYMTDGLKCFSSAVTGLEADAFATVVANILSAVMEVSSNGFLSVCNIDLSFDRIYMDPVTYTVKLIYLPVRDRLFASDTQAQESLRTGLARLTEELCTGTSLRTAQLRADLADRALTFSDLCMRASGRRDLAVRAVNPDEKDSSVLMRLTSADPSVRAEIAVNKDEFLIGRKRGAVDAVISFNNMIGRVHCKINFNAGKFTVTDLQSTNGTYINGVRLQPSLAHMLKDGDVLRLANSDFLVSVPKGDK